MRNTKYYYINDVVNSDVKTNRAFIISNERPRRDGTIGRYYTVFRNFKSFLKNRDEYPHCHEAMINHHALLKPDISGRLVFDFDIYVKIQKSFKKDVEKIIIDTANEFLINVDTSKFEFVWSSCENSKKISKHLTVKNLLFTNWLTLCTLFYSLFTKIWDDTIEWISSKDMIDRSILRKNGTLRMVGSRKILENNKGYGNVLLLDDPKFSLEDSLIRNYLGTDEQIVDFDNFDSDFIKSITKNNTEKTVAHLNVTTLRLNNVTIAHKIYDDVIYNMAFEMINEIDPNVFMKREICGKRFALTRMEQSYCFICNVVHEHENAFIYIHQFCDDAHKYIVYYFCPRCKDHDTDTKARPIGYITDIAGSGDDYLEDISTVTYRTLFLDKTYDYLDAKNKISKLRSKWKKSNAVGIECVTVIEINNDIVNDAVSFLNQISKSTYKIKDVSDETIKLKISKKCHCVICDNNHYFDHIYSYLKIETISRDMDAYIVHYMCGSDLNNKVPLCAIRGETIVPLIYIRKSKYRFMDIQCRRIIKYWKSCINSNADEDMFDLFIENIENND